MSPKTAGPRRDVGSWDNPAARRRRLGQLKDEFDQLCRKWPKLRNTNNYKHLGTLGSGNHFVEICLDEEGFVWLMLHSGSRGVGNAIGTHFIELAKQDMRKHMPTCPTRTWPISRKAPSTTTITWKRSAGPRSSRASTAK
jgi:tRNA-splicing ligase RtcB